jgi:hydrogenase expression/formation protein HypC
LLAKAEIDFGGIMKPIHMACVPEAKIGDYVLVHAGVALTVIDEQAARRLLDELSKTASSHSADRASV